MPDPEKFSYGGQAVLEGVMMRGAHVATVAVRAPNGEIVVHEEPLNAALYRGWIARVPFVRGLTVLWDALVLGTRALMYSADVALSEEDEEIKFTGPLGIGTLLVSLAFGIGLFFLLPVGVASLVSQLLGVESGILFNLIEGVVRLALVIGYIWAIGLMPDIRRLFAYHGAEHKVINAYTDDAPLTVEGVTPYPVEHPRCGTGFLLSVVAISVLVFSLLGKPPAIWLVTSRLLLVPVIAGIAYEYMRFTAKHMGNPLIRALIAPNLALQKLTTRQPTPDMLEVSLAAMKRLLEAERKAAEADGQPTFGLPAVGDREVSHE